MISTFYAILKNSEKTVNAFKLNAISKTFTGHLFRVKSLNFSTGFSEVNYFLNDYVSSSLTAFLQVWRNAILKTLIFFRQPCSMAFERMSLLLQHTKNFRWFLNQKTCWYTLSSYPQVSQRYRSYSPKNTVVQRRLKYKPTFWTKKVS